MNHSFIGLLRMCFSFYQLLFFTNIRNDLIKTQNKTKARFSQVLRNQRLHWHFFLV